MTFNEYAEWSRTTAIYPNEGILGLVYCGLKVNGEAGEIAEKIGKIIRDNKGAVTDTHRLDIALEIGDIIWYCANLAHEIGYDLQTIVEMNQRKLESRKERGALGGSGDKR